MREYELVVLYHPDLEIDLDKALKKVEGILKEQKAKITASDNWGKRKLAYPIKKEDHAIYVFYEISIDPQALIAIEGTLNITDEVLRYLITKPVPVDEEASKDASKSTKESKKDEIEDEKTADEGAEEPKKKTDNDANKEEKKTKAKATTKKAKE